MNPVILIKLKLLPVISVKRAKFPSRCVNLVHINTLVREQQEVMKFVMTWINFTSFNKNIMKGKTTRIKCIIFGLSFYDVANIDVPEISIILPYE